MRLEARMAAWGKGVEKQLVWANICCLVQILRLLNTNVDGKQKVMYALTKIKGVGRRYSNLVCKKADVDLNKRYANTPNPLWLWLRFCWLPEATDRNHQKLEEFGNLED